ncbi:FecR domain-containing protein [Pararhizobium sp. BT-229]|uniref:FecR family protein n=1 Tax=Pararhizobium sp. BT-229 TaxID=2986923 RepID=UPI0021F6A599|nr:FecR domain-containing protein [Pararhizobium sp. BT-229]MCV9963103.1 FecR domain-containing protein [Pararhizobium sp. BT-229]
MLHLRHAAIAAVSCSLCNPIPAMTAEQVGQAVEIKTLVSGAGGELAVHDPVHRDERIRTSKSGLGQFVFQDGTKLAVGWGSSVVLDDFVFDNSRSMKKLTIRAMKGTFRWVSGRSKHAAYEILTPAGTIGVRGTVFDFYIGGDGTTAIVLLGGAAQFCGAGGCANLTQRCDSVVARRNGGVSDPRRVEPGIFNTLGDQGALPFLSGSQTLSGGWGGFGGGCGLAKVEFKPNDKLPREIRRVLSAPNKPEEEEPDKEKPSKDRPDKDRLDKYKPDRDRPDKGRPDKDRPDKDRPDKDGPDKDRPDKDKPDRDRPDKDRPDKDKPDKDRPDKDKPDRDRPDKDRPDKDKPDRDRPDKDRPDKDKPDRDRPDKDHDHHDDDKSHNHHDKHGHGDDDSHHDRGKHDRDDHGKGKRN